QVRLRRSLRKETLLRGMRWSEFASCVQFVWTVLDGLRLNERVCPITSVRQSTRCCPKVFLLLRDRMAVCPKAASVQIVGGVFPLECLLGQSTEKTTWIQL